MASWRGLGRGLKAAGEGLGKVVLPAMEEISKEKRLKEEAAARLKLEREKMVSDRLLQEEAARQRQQTIDISRENLGITRGTQKHTQDEARRAQYEKYDDYREELAHNERFTWEQARPLLEENRANRGISSMDDPFDETVERDLFQKTVLGGLTKHIGGLDETQLRSFQDWGLENWLSRSGLVEPPEPGKIDTGVDSFFSNLLKAAEAGELQPSGQAITAEQRSKISRLRQPYDDWRKHSTTAQGQVMQRLEDISDQSSIEARREAIEAGLVTEATTDAKRTRDWFHDTEQRAYRLKYANELAYQTESGRKQAEAEYLGREAPFTQMELQGRAKELNENYGTLFADYGNLRKLVLLARKSRAELTKHELAFLEKTVALEILNAAQDPEGINGNLQEAARAILADKNAWQANPFASGAVDAAIINIYQRLIDPGVSVRQSEFDVHIEGVSYGQQAKQFVRGEWIRVREFIPPNVRASMLGSADLMMQTHMSFYIAERVPIDLAIHVGKYNPALFSPNWIPRLFGEKSEEARALRGQIPALLGVGGDQLEEWEWNPSHPEYYTKGLSRYNEEVSEREEETTSPPGTEPDQYIDPATGKIY